MLCEWETEAAGRSLAGLAAHQWQQARALGGPVQGEGLNVAAILATMARHHLVVAGDFLDRMTARPARALAELVWNSLDADAATVEVIFHRSEMEGIEAVEVRDNGHGMTHEQAVTAFGALGGSWKRIERQSKGLHRELHGSAGRGRFYAFGLGGVQVRWRTVAEDGGVRKATTVEVSSEARDYFDVSEPENTDEPVGTVVRVDGISDVPRGLLGERTWTDLVTEFALYIERYRPEIVVDERLLDPGPLQVHSEEYTLTETEPEDPPVLMVVEWSIPVHEVIYLCGRNGISLESVKVTSPAPGFEYTAYLRWHGIEDRAADLAMIEAGHPVLAPLVDLAQRTIAEHFARRQRERARTVIEEWRHERVYPYVQPPAGRIEEAERDLFEVVAIAAAPAVNATSDARSRRLTLQLLRQAVERSPAALEEVLEHVLRLPPAQIEELRHLLRRHSLSAIIAASRLVTDRLEFLAALRIMVFDRDTRKTVRERSELHRMLENETWIFGEEYNLTASDRSLTKVLAEHIRILGRDELVPPSEALDVEGHRRIVDLMLARTVPQGRQKHEHLVVELKAPSVVIGDTELTQIKNYAKAVVRNPQFERLDVRWDFVVVSTDLTESAKSDANQGDREPGLVWENQEGVRVWARTWAEIIDKADYRLNFIKEKLGYAPTDELALEYLRQTHAAYVPESLRLDETKGSGVSGPADA